MPNNLAYIVLFMWPIIGVILFRRFPIPVALVWSIFIGYLLLPTQTSIDLPMLPEFDKIFLPSFTALIMSMIFVKQCKIEGSNSQIQGKNTTLTRCRSLNADTYMLRGWLPQNKLRYLVLLFPLSSILTALSNDDLLIVGERFIKGLTTYDAFSAGLSSMVILMPFILGRKFLFAPRSHLIILQVLCIAGIGYALLALIEVRLSPQLNRWIYGFFPHSFVQHVRNGGFRPIIFLTHGLLVGLFFSMALLATLGLLRTIKKRIPAYVFIGAILLFVTLLLSKNFGAVLIFMIIGPLVMFAGIRLQMLVAAAIGLSVMLFPIMRGADLVPTEQIITIVDDISPARARSLGVRIRNEDILLAHANEKPTFGWGGWGRSRVYNSESGEDISITDGLWVIVLGEGGWVKYLLEFGLLTIPILLLLWRQKYLKLTMPTSLLCLILAANLIDLIPNSGLTVISWLIAGALLGRFEMGPEKSANDNFVKSEKNLNVSPYRRQHLRT